MRVCVVKAILKIHIFVGIYTSFARIIYLNLFEAVIWLIITTLKWRFPSEIVNMTFLDVRKLRFVCR